MASFAAVLGLVANAIPGKKDEKERDIISIQMEDSGVPMKILTAIEEHIAVETSPSTSVLEQWTKACEDLIEIYAMCDEHYDQLVNIKKFITSKNPELGNRINLDRFSKCALYPGKIAFARSFNVFKNLGLW